MPVPDLPTDEDKLGFDRFAIPLAKSIAAAAADRRATPWTIGVYGEWGSGKTTFLKLVEKALRKGGVHPIWFNAWRYLREDNLWAALIEEIVTGARKAVPWYRPDLRLRVWWRSIDFRSGLWELVRKLSVLAFRIAMVTLLVLMALSVLPGGTNPVPGWLSGNQALNEPWVRVLIGVVAALGTKPDALMKVFDIRLGADLTAFRRRRAHRSQTALLDDFNTEFKAVLDVVYLGRKKPLVLIIDDLDRCLPEQTLQIIETLKLFLDEQGCVFLLAVDREIIEHAVRSKYGDLPTAGDLGETYFEKIVQLPYSLPPPAPSLVESYIKSISSDADVEACLPILRGTSPYNPRRIKRSVQAFSLLKEFAAGMVPSVLAKLVVIQAQYRRVYRAVVDDDGLLARLEQAYRKPSVLEGDGRDLVLAEQVKRFDEWYPALKSLLCLRIDDRDTFVGVELAMYLSFVQTVSAVEPAPDSSSPAGVTQVALSYGPDDSRWGEWVTAQLLGLGVQLAPSVDVDGLDAMIALLSPSWVQADEFLSLVGVARAANVPVVPIMVESCDVPGVLVSDGRPVHRLVGLTSARAKRLLAEALGVTPVAFSDDSAFPGSGSLINNVRPPKPGHVPRPELTRQIEACLGTSSPGTSSVCVLAGMKGSGKSALARAYATTHASGYEITWWLRANSLSQDMAALAQELQVPLNMVQRTLAARGPWLLVYDGAAEPALLVDRLPHVGGGSVLVTSRDASWAEHATVISVGEMTSTEAVAVLEPGDRGVLSELSRALGYSPLALSLAAAYRRKTGVSAEEYRDLLAERGLSLHQELVELLDERALADPLQSALVKLLAAFWSGVDRKLARDVLAVDPVEFDAAVGALRRLSLLSTSGRSLDLPEILKQVVRQQIPRFLSGELLESTIRCLRARVPTVELPLLQAEITADVRLVVKFGAEEAPDACAELLAEVGEWWRRNGDLVGARQLAQEALDLSPGDDTARAVLAAIEEHQPPATVILSWGGEVGERICAALVGRSNVYPSGMLYEYGFEGRRFTHVELHDDDAALRHLIVSDLRPDCVLVSAGDAGDDGDLAPDDELVLHMADEVGVRSRVVVDIDQDAMSVVNELVSETSAAAEEPFRMPITSVQVGLRGERGFLVQGRITRGSLQVGDQVDVVGAWTYGALVAAIEVGGDSCTTAVAGDRVRLGLKEMQASPVVGMVVAAPGTVRSGQEFHALMLAQSLAKQVQLKVHGAPPVWAVVVKAFESEHVPGAIRVLLRLERALVIEEGTPFDCDAGHGVITSIVK
jgi:hypothetical protein